MRIISGTRRGKKLFAPKNDRIRPVISYHTQLSVSRIALSARSPSETTST